MRKAPVVELANPLGDMNTTPLIDVMLVLLIMLIITIPMQTHAVKLDLPDGRPPIIQPPNPIVNELQITKAGAILWNGSSLNGPALRQELRRSQQMNPIPELHLRPDPEARYEVVDRLLGTIKEEHVEKVGFVGNERYMNS
jgi:biopolymer transport protein ExbD